MVGKLELSVSKDMMAVYATVFAQGDDVIDIKLVDDMLAEMEIKTGVKYDVIDQMLTENNYGKEYIIAEGKAPTTGTNGYYTYNFETKETDYRPVIKEDGSVDYVKQRNLVKKGDLLAEYHPAQSGAFGYTVYASMVAPIPVKELPRLHTYQVDKVDDRYFAATSGEPSLKGDNLSVVNVLVFEGDATNIQGIILYTGDVHVKGDVTTGTTINADGNIIVEGIVEGANIEAGKDIIIKGGVHGKEKAVIKAKGAVTSTFIEEATVIANTCVNFNYSYCSNIISNKDIVADGKLGQVIGGSLCAKKSISVKLAGNTAGTKTKLQIIGDNESIEQTCAVIIDRIAYQGSLIGFGENVINPREERKEYHLVKGMVRSYPIGEFVPELVKKVEPKPVVKPCILLVDDEPIILKTLFSYLCKDYTVKAVNSAKDAFVLMENTLPDLILLDYNMPGMDGGEMLETMRKRTWKWYTNVPVIFATGVTDRAVVMKCMSLYPQGYLAKPIEKDQLLKAVNKFFESQKNNDL